ncbi:MAG TPA: DinB family protein [Chthoniobacterales bacterium]|nr:DinB family protein [Chthoniobacterales bacterium]
MKTTFFALVAVIGSAASICAQSSPASPAAKTSAVESATLTKEERDRAVDYLTRTKKDFLAAIEGVSEEQWKFKAAPDRWSIAETAEHIAVAEETIWKLVSEKIMKSPAAPEKRAEVKGKDETILTVIPDRSRKAQAPERLKPTGRWATRVALVKDFEAIRGQEITYLKETKEDLRNHFEEHPFLKTMDAWQWLLFNGAHAKRHTAQILEVKADPNFPKS